MRITPTLQICLLVIAVGVSACSPGSAAGRAVDSESSAKDEFVVTASTANEPVPTTARVVTTLAAATTIPPTTPPTTVSPTTTTVPPGGTRQAPVVAGDPARLGDWELTVLSVLRDGTAAVMNENRFNDPPTDDHQFFLVRVAAKYLGTGSDRAFGALSLLAVGPTSVGYDTDDRCGVIPEELPFFREVFSGGVIVGNVCWSVRSDDVAELTLYAEPRFSLDDVQVFFTLPPDGVEFDIPPADSPSLVDDGVGSRGNPMALGETSTIGEWQLTVISSDDITEAVLAENQFNDAPTKGFAFLGVEVMATYTGASTTAFFDDLAVTVVGDLSVAYSFDATCGVIPNPIDFFADVFPGGVLTGQLCWAVDLTEIDSLVLIVDGGLDQSEQRVFLAIR